MAVSNLIMIFTMCIVSVCKGRIMITEGPSNTSVFIGEAVNLCCKFIGTQSHPYWRINGTVYSVNILPPGHEARTNGIYIPSATADQNYTEYMCFFSIYIGGGKFEETESLPAFVQVFPVPEVDNTVSLTSPMTSTGHVYCTPSITTTVSPRKTTENSMVVVVLVAVGLVAVVLLVLYLGAVIAVLCRRRKGRLNITDQNSKKEVYEVAMTPPPTPEVLIAFGVSEEENATDIGRCMSHPSMASSIASKQPSFHRSVSEGGNPQGSARFYTSKDENIPEED